MKRRGSVEAAERGQAAIAREKRTLEDLLAKCVEKKGANGEPIVLVIPREGPDDLRFTPSSLLIESGRRARKQIEEDRKRLADEREAKERREPAPQIEATPGRRRYRTEE